MSLLKRVTDLAALQTAPATAVRTSQMSHSQLSGGAQSSRGRLLGGLRWCGLWPALFIAALIVPTDLSFSLGPLRLTPYRVVLILAFFPSVSRVFSGRSGGSNIVDWTVLTHTLWCFLVITAYHGLEVSIESVGIRLVEFGGAYFLARAYVTDERSFQGVVIAILAAVLVLLPLLVLESTTGFNPIHSVSSDVVIEKRMGLSRAFGPMDHPILLGVFASSVFAIAWLRVFPRLGRPRPRRTLVLGVTISALTSISSGAMASLMTQITLLLWQAKTRANRHRWRLFGFLLLGAYVAIDLFSNRTPMVVLLSYLTFSAETAYGRIEIFEWGMADVMRNPLMGIGFNEWTRPHWKSASMDNFWLLQAVTFGIPGFLTFAIVPLLVLTLGWRRLPPRLTRLRMAWAISMIGLVLAGCTVHFWNNLFSYYAFFVGIGVWFINSKRTGLSPSVDNNAEPPPY